jgi:hypothetical protein
MGNDIAELSNRLNDGNDPSWRKVYSFPATIPLFPKILEFHIGVYMIKAYKLGQLDTIEKEIYDLNCKNLSMEELSNLPVKE